MTSQHANETPTISVVIPAFNADRYLAECLDSVLQQDVHGLEVIVVDDGSTDGTRELVARYGAAVRYVWQPNSGGCAVPRNHGARLAAGEYLAFFDADDLMCPRRLSAQHEILRRRPELGLVLSDYRNFDEMGDHSVSQFATCRALLAATGLKLNGDLVEIDPVDSNLLLVRENFSIASSPLFRKSAWVEAGGFDETLKASEDFDLVYRVARRHPIALLGAVGFRRRLHASNMSKQTLRILQCKVESRSKLLSEETDPALRRALRESIAEFELAASRALADTGHSGAVVSYVRALRRAPVRALRGWRVLARAMLLAAKNRRVYRP